MKKFLKDKLFRTGKVWSKFWKIMRLQLLIVLVTLFQLHAETGVAQEKVSISFENALIEDIIKEVEIQSGYVVVYNNTLLKSMNRVTVHLTNVNAKEALNAALKGSGLECKLVEDFLVISKKEENDNKEKIASLADARPSITASMKYLVYHRESPHRPIRGMSGHNLYSAPIR